MLEPIDLKKIDFWDRMFGRDDLIEEINQLRIKVQEYENAAMWANMWFKPKDDDFSRYTLIPHKSFYPQSHGDGLYGPARSGGVVRY